METMLAPANLETVLAGLSFRQRQYLSVLAMKGDEILARRLSGNDAKLVAKWRKDSLFSDREKAVTSSDGQWKSDGFSMWLEYELPDVLGELTNMLHMEAGDGRTLAVKERSIEFFLKELCGLTKNIKKSVSLDKLLLGLMEQGGDNAANGNR